MVKIPVAIKQASQASEQDIKKALNLNQVFSGVNAQPRPQKRRFFWLIAIVALAVTTLGLGAKVWLDSQKNFSKYQGLIGPETKTFAAFKTDHLEGIVGLAFIEAQQSIDVYPWLKGRVAQFLADSQISMQNDLIPVFDEEAFFLVMTSETNNFVWVAGGKTKADKSFQAQKAVEKIETGLHKSFGANESLYRQIKINSAYSFSQINKAYYWSQIDDFVLVSNDLSAIQQIIDKIISR